MALTFKNLEIGDSFIFTSEKEFPYSGIEKGPWRKMSARTYIHTRKDMRCTVGSIGAHVEKAPA